MVCDGSHVHRVRFRGAGLPGLLSPFLYAAAAVLPMAANLLRRLIRLIGGSR